MSGSVGTSSSNRHLCVQWPTVGPYHLARLKRTAKRCDELSIRLTVLELSEEDIMGRKAVISGASPAFERVTLFPGCFSGDLSPRRVAAEVRKGLDLLDPDVVAINSYSMPDARSALEWCLSKGRGSILMTDSREEDAKRIRWREWFKAIIVSRFGAALVAGSQQVEYLKTLGFPEPCVFLGYDVVDNEHFAQSVDAIRSGARKAEDHPGLGDETPFFLTVGRIIRRKGVETLIEAYARYRRSVPDPWRLILVGSGNDLHRMEQYAAEMGLRHVTFAGDQPAEAIPAYYARAGALVHPATSDQWGLVVNEAMASGLPVIVSDGAGSAIDLVVENQNGFSFRAGEASQLAELMKIVASDEQLRQEMSVKARQIIAEWSLDRFATSLIDAMECAESRAARRNRLDPGRLALSALRLVTRKMTSFHSVEA